MFAPPEIVVSKRAKTHMRNVKAGISGSSIFETDARTYRGCKQRLGEREQ